MRMKASSTPARTNNTIMTFSKLLQVAQLNSLRPSSQRTRNATQSKWNLCAQMGVFTLHASNIKGFAFEFVRARPVWPQHFIPAVILVFLACFCPPVWETSALEELVLLFLFVTLVRALNVFTPSSMARSMSSMMLSVAPRITIVATALSSFSAKIQAKQCTSQQAQGYHSFSHRSVIRASSIQFLLEFINSVFFFPRNERRVLPCLKMMTDVSPISSTLTTSQKPISSDVGAV